MEVIAEETWSWMLFQNSNSYYLSVVCGSVGIFTRDIELTESEISEFKTKGIPYIKLLSSQISDNSSVFKGRHLNSFENMQGVKEATEKWCLEKNSNK